MTTKKPGPGARGVRGRRPPAIMLAVALALVTLAAFWPALDNAFVSWDDPRYVTDNYLIRDLSPVGLQRILAARVEGNYHPVTMLSLALDYRAWGLNARGYHLTNVTLHVVNTLLVYWLLLMLSGSQLIAGLVALFFGVHPMHVESVAWVSGRKDVLYTCFYLAGLAAYVLWTRPQGPRPLYYAAAIAAFILSLLSKAMAVTFPVVLLLLDRYTNREITRARSALEKAPFFALAVFLGLVTIVAQREQGALQEIPVYPLLDRLLIACYSLVAYLGKALVPASLSAFYPYPAKPGGTLPPVFFAAPLVLLGLAAAAFALRRRARGVAFGGLFYAANLLFVLQVLPVGNAMMADRYTYLAYVGVAVMLAELTRLAGSHASTRGGPTPALVVSILAAFMLGLVPMTGARCNVWQDSLALWTDTIRASPNAAVAWSNHALAVKALGRYEEAAADLDRALRINPAYPEAWCNRGTLFFLEGQLDSALVNLNRSLSLRRRSPEAYNNRGAVHFRLGQMALAVADFDSALAILPDLPDARLSRANAFSELGEFARALPDYDAYMRMNPSNARAWYWRGLAREEIGDVPGAIADYGESIRLEPTFAPALLARSQVRAARGETAAALADAMLARALGEPVDEAYLARLRGGTSP